VRGLNFPLSTYARANDALDRMSHEQVVAAVRAGRLTARGGFEGARNTDA
jgi:NADH:ubiquinone oxidoreductase subunit F (NADH-binding)